MPLEGMSLIKGPRTLLLSRTLPLYDNFVKETGIEIDAATFKKIIKATSKKMAYSAATDPEGVQLPEIGYLVVSKFKPRKPYINKGKTYKTGKKTLYLNLHTFGYVYKMKWYRAGSRIKNIALFAFRPRRPLNQEIYKSIMDGTNYFVWTSSDLWSMSSLDRRLNRAYKKED